GVASQPVGRGRALGGCGDLWSDPALVAATGWHADPVELLDGHRAAQEGDRLGRGPPAAILAAGVHDYVPWPGERLVGCSVALGAGGDDHAAGEAAKDRGHHG